MGDRPSGQVRDDEFERFVSRLSADTDEPEICETLRESAVTDEKNLRKSARICG
jgi:hypothetical protein